MSFPIKYNHPPTGIKPFKMSPFKFGLEWKSLFEDSRRKKYKVKLMQQPTGNNEVVLLIPGLKSSEKTFEPLREYLNDLGYDARLWGLGTHHGKIEKDAERFGKIVTDIVSQTNKKVNVIAWSMGGLIARETIRNHPDYFDQLITLGTAVIGGAYYTSGALMFNTNDSKRIAQLNGPNAKQLDLPITAVFSKEDGVVSWPACIDTINPNVSHYEVGSTHLALGKDPDVWKLAATVLAHKNP